MMASIMADGTQPIQPTNQPTVRGKSLLPKNKFGWTGLEYAPWTGKQKRTRNMQNAKAENTGSQNEEQWRDTYQ